MAIRRGWERGKEGPSAWPSGGLIGGEKRATPEKMKREGEEK